MNRTEQWEKDKAQELLNELNGMVGSRTPTPRQYRDWNMRAQTFLMFAACMHIGNGRQESVGLQTKIVNHP